MKQIFHGKQGILSYVW